jgi:hypothetical protein
MDMGKISFKNVTIEKINHKLELENRFNWKPPSKSKQTSLMDFI